MTLIKSPSLFQPLIPPYTEQVRLEILTFKDPSNALFQCIVEWDNLNMFTHVAIIELYVAKAFAEITKLKIQRQFLEF